MSDSPFRYPLWTRGDLDGFFGLMVDNLVQVLLIIALCTGVAGMSEQAVFSRVLPGVAISLLIGNVFYGCQARISARRYRNVHCTALPYGINTPSVFAYVLFIMGPVYRNAVQRGVEATAAADLAWKAGLVACLVSGLIEFFGAFVAERLRRVTPRAALLGVLAAVGITFIAADFAFKVYTQPLVAIMPLAILMLAYFAHYKFPGGLPGGFIAVMIGTGLAWLLSIPQVAGVLSTAPLMSFEALRTSLSDVRWIEPQFFGAEIWEFVRANPDLALTYLTVSVPMGLINVLGSLQNIESAAAGGDHYATAPSLAVNGLGSLAAGLFGSCFPTTIYIGHPAWKALGARSGYSILNGLFFTACFLFGGGAFLGKLIPIEAGAAIVVYIGIVITAQAFQATPEEHAPAVAISLFPAIAAILMVNLPLFMVDAGAARTLADMLTGVGPTPSVSTLPGMMALNGANSSWLVTSLVLAAAGASLIDRRYTPAAWWFAVAAVLTATGLLHAYRVEGNVVSEYFAWQTPAANGKNVFTYRALPIAVGYALSAGILAVAAMRARRARETLGGFSTGGLSSR